MIVSIKSPSNRLKSSPFHPRVGIRNISDYSPFGILLPERTIETANFRRGFQGQEHDDEVKGEGNSVNFKYRMHDPRVGRFFAVDPLSSSYPELTPYQFSSNSPIFMIEFEGLEGKIAVTTKWYTNKGIEKSKTKYYTVDGLKADLIKICWKPHGNPKGPVVEIDYYGRMEDGTRSGNSLKGVNPDAKPTVAELNAFFASDPNNSFNVKKIERARAAAEKIEADFDNSIEGIIYNNVLADGALEGNHDASNQGGWGGDRAREIKGATGALSVILSPFTIAGGGVYILFGSVGLLNGTDDMVGAIKNADNESLSQSLISDPNYKNLVGNIKTGATFFTAIGGGVQMWKQGIDAPTLLGEANDMQSLIRDVYDRVNQKSTNESNSEN